MGYAALLLAKVPRYMVLELGDLVFRRRFQVDKSLGMKLRTKWDTTWLLSCIAKSSVSGDLKDLKTGKFISRYAFESLKVYSTCHENNNIRIGDVSLLQKDCQESRPIIQEKRLSCDPVYITFSVYYLYGILSV